MAERIQTIRKPLFASAQTYASNQLSGDLRRRKRVNCEMASLFGLGTPQILAILPNIVNSDNRGNMNVPADLKEKVQRSSRIGRLLYLLDKVAAIGTDVMFANLPDPHALGLRGYVPVHEADDQGNPLDSFLVLFFNDESPPRIAFEVRVAPDRMPEFQTVTPPRDAGQGIATLIRARQIALAALPNYGQPINPVMVPGALNDEDGILVYLLAGTSKPDLAVFGRHFRALIPRNGTEVSYMMPLSKSILEVPTKSEDGHEVEALTVTHLVTEFPLETHVFTSLLIQMPVYVVTNRGLWFVRGDQISFVRDLHSE